MSKKQEEKELNIQDLANVMTSMMDVFHSEEDDFYKELSKNVNPKDIDNYEDFYIQLVRPAEKYLSGFIRTEISTNRDMDFFLRKSNFIENNFKHWIVRKEGSPCSSDKSRTIMKSLFNYFKNNEEIIFNLEQEYTYHIPKKVFNNHSDIIEFFKSLHHMYYGNPEYYLENILKISQK